MSVQGDYLQDIADAIREKEGSSGKIMASEFAERVRGLETFNGIRYKGWDNPGSYQEGVLTVAKRRIKGNIIIAPSPVSAEAAMAYRTPSGLWMAQTINSSGVGDFVDDIFTDDGEDYRWAICSDGYLTDCRMLFMYSVE